MPRIAFLAALAACLIAVALAGCATVRPEDLAAWKGRPVADLDRHPMFAAMKLVRTYAADGTEIRNYMNGVAQTACSGGGSVNAYSAYAANFNQQGACISRTPTCNNIFYIKGGIVQQYTPIGSGGAKCFTDDRARPGFSGPTNF
jgi:hypothetical protein